MGGYGADIEIALGYAVELNKMGASTKLAAAVCARDAELRSQSLKEASARVSLFENVAAIDRCVCELKKQIHADFSTRSPYTKEFMEKYISDYLRRKAT